MGPRPGPAVCRCLGGSMLSLIKGEPASQGAGAALCLSFLSGLLRSHRTHRPGVSLRGDL